MRIKRGVMGKYELGVCLLIVGILTAPVSALSASLHVSITNMQSCEGKIIVELVDEEGFKEDDVPPIQTLELEPTMGG